MTLVFVEEIEAVDDPGVEAAADVLGNFLDDVPPVLEPKQFRTRRYRKDGLFTLFAMISELHRRSIPGRQTKGLCKRDRQASAAHRFTRALTKIPNGPDELKSGSYGDKAYG
jgi:hypothetical protein